MQNKRFGVMLDMSRNGVMKVDKVKEFIDYIAKMGYNSLQLYTEDTFEVNNEPYFGYMRGRYTKEDLKEIDAYCIERGIELIPCVQVLAHVNAIFKWTEYTPIRDIDDIMLMGEERTYKLLENIFETVAECFTSRTINICMDEAHGVGLGEYLNKNGYQNRFEILRKHLDKIVEISSKYNFKLIMWSDMFFRLLNGGSYYGNAKINKEVINAVPEQIDLIFWDYYHIPKKLYRNMVKKHRMFKNETWFAGGIWVWGDFLPFTDFTLKTMFSGLSVMKEQKVNNIMLTVWGDDGKECSYFTALPALFRLKKFYDGENNMKKIKQEFKDIVGEDYDRLNSLKDVYKYIPMVEGIPTTTKPLIYMDLFNAFISDYLKDVKKEDFLRLSKRYSKYAKDSKFEHLFKSSSAYLKVLALKFDMPYRLKDAYDKKDIETLKNIAKEIKQLIKAVEEFHQLFRTLWNFENRPQGFDIQDMRLGGLMTRLSSCKQTLLDYIDGKIETIEELDEERLPTKFGGHGHWGKIISPNVLSHNIHVN